MKNVHNRAGVTLTEVMIGMALISLVAIAAANLSVLNSKVSNAGNVANTVQEVRSNVIAILGSADSWSATTQKNTAMSCLYQSTSCQTASPGVFDLYQGDPSAGPTLYFPSATSSGFNLDGKVCNTFAAPPAKGNDACPIGLSLSWSIASCDTTSGCVNPLVRVTGTFVYNSATKALAFNPANYKIDMLLGVTNASANEQSWCEQTLKGTWNASKNPHCSVFGNAIVSIQCPAGTALAGRATDGSPYCLQGPPGANGPQGPQGPQGPPGP